LSKINRSPKTLESFEYKNAVPLAPIHHREKLEEAERKLFVVLVKPEKHQRSLLPLAKSK
jgi:hypothetical protein